MAALPVIASCFRCVITWSTQSIGVPVVNTFHVREHNVGTDPGDIKDKIEGSLGDHKDCFAFMPSQSQMAELAVTPLDGHTAPVLGVTPGNFGEGTGNSIPAMAQLVKFTTGERGARGRGRIYIGPVTEDRQSAGTLDAGLCGTVQTAWVDYNADLSNAIDHPCSIVVASYVHADMHDVAAITVPTIAATQRGRQDSLR